MYHVVINDAWLYRLGCNDAESAKRVARAIHNGIGPGKDVRLVLITAPNYHWTLIAEYLA